MDVNKVLKKIEKLLALAESSNINEAASAAAMAQELMDRYNLSTADLSNGKEDDDPSKAVDDFELMDTGARWNRYKEALAMMLAEHNHCVLYINTTHKRANNKRGWKKARVLRLVGTQSDAQACTYMFYHLKGEITRLAKQVGGGLGPRWLMDFRLGAIATIRKRLKEMREDLIRDMQVSSTALVKFDERMANADAWAEENLGLEPSKSRNVPKRDWSAFDLGQAAGATINLDAKGSLPASKDRLKA